MGYRYRWMYYMTGLPGWIRFGFSPGWIGRSPTGLPPTAQWIMSSGLLPQYLSYLQSMVPPTVPPPTVPPTTVPPTTAPIPPTMPFGPHGSWTDKGTREADARTAGEGSRVAVGSHQEKARRDKGVTTCLAGEVGLDGVSDRVLD